MKKIIIAIVAFVAVTGAVSAQEQTIGGNLNFASDPGSVGIGVRYTYALGNFRLAPEVVLLFPDQGTEFDLNANIHYTFEVAPRVTIYPLAGFNYSYWSWNGYNSSDFGLNIGVGGEYAITNSLAGYAEFKGILGDGSRANFAMGVAYKF